MGQKIKLKFWVMQFLFEWIGFLEFLYKGDWKNGKRHGFGIQLFPNGAKFIGNWKKNMAHGFGWLEYINGTSYEGKYEDNCIIEGTLKYFSGTFFSGKFYKESSLFMEGFIRFRDNEEFYREWAPNGVTVIGHLITSRGEKMFLKQENLVRKGEELISSKIIYYNKGCFYEGGLFRDHYD